MDQTCRQKFLVIDDREILEIKGLTRKVNQAVKHPEPVLKMDASLFEPSTIIPASCESVCETQYHILKSFSSPS